MKTAAGTAKAGRKEWIGLGVIALPCAGCITLTRLGLQHLGEFMNGQPNKTNPVATLKAFRTSVAGLVLIAGFAMAFQLRDQSIACGALTRRQDAVATAR